MKFTLPIYQEKKGKPFLVGMNWYRNAHFFQSNKIKDIYHAIVKSQITTKEKFETINPAYKIYIKNIQADGPNIRAVMEKFFLDGLVEAGVIQDDNVRIVLGDTTKYFIDKQNPRCEIEI